MKSVDAVLKSLVAGLVRKQIRTMRKSMRGDIAALARAVSKLEAALKRSKERAGKKKTKQEGGIPPARIRKIRTGLGHTQAGFAKLLQVSPSAVIGWEAGRFHPRRDVVAKILALRKEPGGGAASQEKAAEEEIRPGQIKKIRRKLGVSQKDFARLLKVSLGAVAAWEAGKHKPRPEIVAAMEALRDAGKAKARETLGAL